MKTAVSSLKFTIMFLMIGCVIETALYQETFPKHYNSLNEAWHYTVLSMKHAFAFFVVYFIPTFGITYCFNKITN